MLMVSLPQRKQQAPESAGSMGFTQTSPVNPSPHGPAPLEGLETAQEDEQKQNPNFHASDTQLLLLPALWLGFSWNEFVSNLKQQPLAMLSHRKYSFSSPFQALMCYAEIDNQMELPFREAQRRTHHQDKHRSKNKNKMRTCALKILD